jgi:hypothetical protein
MYKMYTYLFGGGEKCGGVIWEPTLDEKTLLAVHASPTPNPQGKNCVLVPVLLFLWGDRSLLNLNLKQNNLT